MAEDIDIEEHDLLQNPKIQSLFPDLSILKQEVIDFDEGCSEITIKSMEMDTNISVVKHEFTDDLNESEISMQSDFVSQETDNLTKITDLKVTLQNVKPFLRETKTFCDKCLTLFPNKESLTVHILSVHEQNKSFSRYKKIFSCNVCEIPFTRKGNLRRHERNVHYIKKVDNTTINSENTTGNIEKTFAIEKNFVFREACFHCREIFPNPQDLIDHLYTVLYNKKTQVLKENDVDMESKASGLQNYYSCPVCSYYFKNEMFCKSHAIMKHKAIKKIRIQKSSFNPKCKFCKSNHKDILSYNTHLRKSHKTEMLKPFNDELPSNSGEKSNLSLPKDIFADVYTKYDHLTILEQNSKNQNNQKQINYNVQVIASKITLFKCSECNIHFLTFDAAFKHLEHLTLKINWQCTSCHRLFKNKDANTHQKQHQYSEYFVIEKVDAEVDPTTLYKCFMCAVHFSKETFSEHYNICESEEPRSTNISYCNVCDIFVESSIKTSHENDHNVRNLTLSDIKIIDSDLPAVRNDNKIIDKYDVDKKYKEEKPGIPDAMIIDIDNSINIHEGSKYREVSKIPKSRFDSSGKKQLSYNFCNVCKCNICIIYKPDIHLRSHCVNIIKYTCKFCGLIFSSKSIKPHRRLHQQYKSLKLQDLTFYNLQTNKMMKPLIPEFPKCELCDKHFISKAEIKGHLCDLNDNIKCSICKKKFSETAHKLHVQFHNYNLKRNRLKELDNKIDTSCDQNEIKNDPPINETKPSIYTCKNCDVSLSTYDGVIEHCHLHTNLNKVEINCIQCAICQLNFADLAYEGHVEMHKTFEKSKFTRFYFDVSYFGSDKWLKHIYKSKYKDELNKLIGESIYKYETRITMEIIQEGPSNLTIYKCDKCQCIIDCNSAYSHLVTCCPSSKSSSCKICDLSFACSVTRNKHEKVHATLNISRNSYRIVIFNRVQDRNINSNIANFISTRKCYVVHECRHCHVLVEHYNYAQHICFRNECKKCNICGLLLYTENLKDHLLKHKLIPSFNENKIKVVLIGNKSEGSNILQSNDSLLPTFNGIVCDYTFYKCINCEVCVRDVRNTVHHSCLIDAAKSQCIKCDLVFDEGKLKGHLKLHDTDPDFTKETILVKHFNNIKLSKNIIKFKKTLDVEFEKSDIQSIENNMHATNEVNTKVAMLYKCTCGLHFMQQSSLQEHIIKCCSKNKTRQSIQNCSKCGLRFKPDVLFRHILEHHGDKNVVFKYEIVENSLEG